MATLPTQVLEVCQIPGQKQLVQQLLTADADIFSRCERYVGRATLVEHPICIDSRYSANLDTWPKNDREVKEQIQSLD